MLESIIALFGLLLAPQAPSSSSAPFVVERITTKVPFPRGLRLVDGELYVLSRGRVRRTDVEEHA